MNFSIQSIKNKFTHKKVVEVDIENKTYNLKHAIQLIEDKNLQEFRTLLTPINPYDKSDILNNIKDWEFEDIIADIYDILEPESIINLSYNKKHILLTAIGYETIADTLLKLDNDEIVAFLAEFDKEKLIRIKSFFPRAQRKNVRLALTYANQEVGRVMETDFLSVAKNSSIEQVRHQFQEHADDISEHIRDIFVIDDNGILIGTVSMFDLIKYNADTPVLAILNDDFKTVYDKNDVSEIVYMFDKYDLTTLSVINNEGKIIGFISSDIARDITISETQEDILKLSGVVDEDSDDRVFKKAYTRSIWLFVNIIASFISANVIRNFEGIIAQYSFLAALLPIVASMGGNSGMQTVTLTIRMIAMKSLNEVNKYSVMFKEIAISLMSASFFFAISFILSYVIYHNAIVSLLFAIAVATNILFSAILGFLIPLAMKKIGTDPAITSTIFLTTATDFLGFSLFLSLIKIFF